MNPRIFDQGSGEWASYPYPNGDTVKSNGCGLLAITNVAIEIENYRDKTPVYFYPFMKQYAVYDNGTKRQGIEDALDKYFGNHITHNVSSSMKSVWDALGKGNTIAIILFGGGTAYGVKIEPTGILIIKDGNVRLMNVLPPASNTLDRIIDMTPDMMEKVDQLIDKIVNKK